MQVFNEKNKKNLEIIVGYFFTIAIIIFFIVILILIFRTKWTFLKASYTTYYEYGNDIEKGTLVTLNGIKIGEVKTIDIDENNRVKIFFSISRKYKDKIRENSTAKIVRPLLIGNKQILISPGTKDFEILPPGSIIPSEESSELIDLVSGINIQNFLDKIGLNSEQTNNDYIKKISIREIYEQAIASLVTLNEFQNSIKDMSDSMRCMGDGMNAMGSGFSELGNAMNGMNNEMGKFADNFDTINESLEDFGPLSEKLIPLLDELEILIKAVEMNPLLKNEVEKVRQKKEK